MGKERQDQARDNRLLMPQCSQVIDDFKEVFGADQVKVTYASENNIPLGRPGVGEPQRNVTGGSDEI